ncbi:MAG: precorrin-6B C5,15-methyltransferase / cobalt-precorrin-6B C5,C15-methyltransferase, partial [Pseudonocardiales bacterium]|nr:precorrin-6B C5,15-methyltransferase / cobalt-precorrin-6B C5,C15-methyltransferase [Pseudonocardiales bacterium]
MPDAQSVADADVRPAAEPVVVVGIGADGWDGLNPAARAALAEAELVLGSQRQLALLPADLAAERPPWPSPLLPAKPDLLAQRHRARFAVLASGD